MYNIVYESLQVGSYEDPALSRIFWILNREKVKRGWGGSFKRTPIRHGYVSFPRGKLTPRDSVSCVRLIVSVLRARRCPVEQFSSWRGYSRVKCRTTLCATDSREIVRRGRGDGKNGRRVRRRKTYARDASIAVTVPWDHDGFTMRIKSLSRG